MLTLVELLAEVKTICESSDPKKIANLVALFADPKLPAEYQVARHYAGRRLQKELEDQLTDIDGTRRRAAIDAIGKVMPASIAGNLLRRVVRDPDPRVRGAAKDTIVELRLGSARPPALHYRNPMGRGDAASWAFGIFATNWVDGRKPKKPTKVNALAAYKLPRLADQAAVAKLAGVPLDELRSLMRPGTGKGSAYIEFDIPKAKGGSRRIAAPRDPLRKAQRKILDEILGKVPMHDACHGFVAKRSTVTNAKPHVGAAIVVKLDIRDFFPTVHYRRVVGLFQHLGYGDDVAKTLAGLTTYRPKLGKVIVWPGVLPQGAPTSPALANLACRRLDKRLDRLAAKYDATYTRYADDLTFSFAKQPDVALGRFLWWVDGICQQEGFNERPDKRRILRNKHQQRVTGIVVNAGIHVPRVDKKRFRAILHNCKKHGVASQARGRDDFAAYLRGYAAYVKMVDPVLGAKLVAQVEEVLRG